MLRHLSHPCLELKAGARNTQLVREKTKNSQQCSQTSIAPATALVIPAEAPSRAPGAAHLHTSVLRAIAPYHGIVQNSSVAFGGCCTAWNLVYRGSNGTKNREQ